MLQLWMRLLVKPSKIHTNSMTFAEGVAHIQYIVA